MPKQDRKRKTPRGKRSQDWEPLQPLNRIPAPIEMGSAGRRCGAEAAGRDAEALQNFRRVPLRTCRRLAQSLKACGVWNRLAMDSAGSVLNGWLYQILKTTG